MEKLTSRDFGWAWGAWCEVVYDLDKPVNVDDMVNRTVDIPDEDYQEMRRVGIEPDAREYWNGYNDYMKGRE